MSVTIVSTLPRPTEVSTVDKTLSAGNNTTSDDTATLDFASLLLGQLQPLRPVVLDSVQNTAEPTDMTGAEATPSDTTALLAALGFVQQEPVRKADPDQIEDDSNSTPIAMQTAAVIAQNPEQLGRAKTLTSISSQTTPIAVRTVREPVDTDAVPTGTPAIEDRPAKLAAAAITAPTVEITSSKTVTNDAGPSTTTILANNTIGNPSIPAIRHEVSLSVPTPVRDQGWANDLGQKIVWLASNDKQSAQITLNPPQMGPIEISLSLDKGNASASFTSPNSEVRNALETAMPRLREMFASAGIELGQTNVSAESFKQQAENGAANRGASQWRTDNAILVADSAISQSSRTFSAQHGSGLVDLFA